MKKMIGLLLFAFIALSSNAQDKMNNKMDKMDDKMGKMQNKMSDCIKMEDGKMMVYKNGKSGMMETDMTLSNGTMVSTDGTVKLKNGKTVMLKNGESIGLNGKMMHSKMKKEMKDSKL